jgi:hypothetical protein
MLHSKGEKSLPRKSTAPKSGDTIAAVATVADGDRIVDALLVACTSGEF